MSLQIRPFGYHKLRIVEDEGTSEEFQIWVARKYGRWYIEGFTWRHLGTEGA